MPFSPGCFRSSSAPVDYLVTAQQAHSQASQMQAPVLQQSQPSAQAHWQSAHRPQELSAQQLDVAAAVTVTPLAANSLSVAFAE